MTGEGDKGYSNRCAPFYPLQPIRCFQDDDADRERNSRGMTVGFRARCSRIPSVSKARRRRQDGMRMERESSDIKSSRRRRMKIEAQQYADCVLPPLHRGKMRRRREAMRIEDLLAALNLQERR